jgi:hypothetical protein
VSSKDATSRREFIGRAAALGAGLALPSIAVAAPPQATTAAPVAPRTDAVAVADSAGRAAGTTQAGRTYATINQLSWNEILADRGPELAPPLTVHLPIQPAHSPDLVHVDCALNASRRIVVPGLSTKNVQACQAAQEMETFVVQFAIDDPPFVPDYRRSKLALADNRHPLAHADYFLADMLYQFDYHCTAIDAEQNVLWVVVSASNEGELAQHAHVRAKINFQRECDVHFYHYTPFFWDNTKWQPCKGVRLEEHRL